MSKPDAGRADATVSDPSDIIVTGSRIVRNGYTAPTPVTVATTEDLVKTTPSNIPDGLNKLPQFANSQSSSRSAVTLANAPIKPVWYTDLTLRFECPAPGRPQFRAVRHCRQSVRQAAADDSGDDGRQ